MLETPIHSYTCHVNSREEHCHWTVDGGGHIYAVPSPVVVGGHIVKIEAHLAQHHDVPAAVHLHMVLLSVAANVSGSLS
jgi:hypothetical protein